jgi:hypothetical protein
MPTLVRTQERVLGLFMCPMGGRVGRADEPQATSRLPSL